MASSSNQPNTTLYINNLNDKVHTDELKTQLYALFTTYGKIIDIVASKGKSMRGQAFLVFTDLAGATSAMRACEGMLTMLRPPKHIDYAKSKSYATLRREDPLFVPPNAANASAIVSQNAKRQREDEGADERNAKREKADSDEEEMEIDDDDDTAQPNNTTPCTLYQGFQAARVTADPTPSASGAKVKLAQVTFENSELAAAAKTGLDGFTLKKGWVMSVAFI
ncbi:hypothetical protein H0H81_007917 [Sphagnurus paluster]|uniref:RRM domain-containing protein n=1 Tax=Sphagnurus paluster TaxID=117069 RepID=A0A9P7FVB7_9AGAR|nr:hypothetical protein H0H81_007917 [Sphagnurus paluster]